MAKKLTRPVPVTAPDLLQQLRGRIELARRNDGTWDAMDGGKMTPMKLAVAMVLWTQHKCLENAGIDSLLAGKRAIGDDLWAAVEKIRYEIMIADIEELVREREDEKEHGETRSAYGRAWVEAVLSVEPPKRPDHICSECRVQVGGNTASCAGCHHWDARWRAIEEVRSKRTGIRTRLEAVLKKHEFPLEYLNRIARLPILAAEFHELAITEEARIKSVRDEGKRNLQAVASLRSTLQESDGLRDVFRRNKAGPTDLIEKFQRIEADLSAECNSVTEPPDARQSFLEMLSIRHTPGRPVTADGRQRDIVTDGLFTIWVEWIGKAPAANPSAGEKTPFVKLLEDIFLALERESWVTGLGRAAIQVRSERLTK